MTKKQREMGLGSYKFVDLAQARQKALEKKIDLPFATRTLSLVGFQSGRRKEIFVSLFRFVIVSLGCLLWLFAPSNADTRQNIKIQSYLNALGYNVGKLDGIIGKNTTKQLIKALKENGHKFDGQADTNEMQILKKIAINKNIELKERLIGISPENLTQIMDEQTAKLFVPNDRNIKVIQSSI